MGRKGLFSLALLSAALLGAYGFWAQSSKGLQPEALGALLPQFSVAELAALHIAHPDEGEVRLVPDGKAWQVEQKGYPADGKAVAALLKTLSELNKVEARTANPDFYARLKLATEGAANEQGTRLTLESKQGAPRTLVVGNASGSDGQLVRFADQAQSWQVTPALALSADMQSWLDKRITDLAFSEIEKVSVTLASGQTLVVSRSAEAPNMSVEGLAPDSKIAYEPAANGMANVFGNWRFIDVKPLKGSDLGEPALRFVVSTFGRGELTGAIYLEQDVHWLRIESVKDLDANVSASTEWLYLIEPAAYQALWQNLSKVLDN